MKHVLLFSFAAIIGCSGNKSEDSAAPVESGTTTIEEGPVTSILKVSFEIDTDYRDIMEEPAMGPFWGNVFHESEVTGTGPVEGAEVLADIYVPELDLTGAPTAVMLEIGPVTTEKIVILGFLDSDQNADPDAPSPDAKDPVTLPGDNRTTLTEGSTDVVVFFGLLNP